MHFFAKFLCKFKIMDINRPDRPSINGIFPLTMSIRNKSLMSSDFILLLFFLIRDPHLIITPQRAAVLQMQLQMQSLSFKKTTCSGIVSGPHLWASLQELVPVPPEPLISACPVPPPPHASIQEFTELFPLISWNFNVPKTPVGGFWYFSSLTPPLTSPNKYFVASFYLQDYLLFCYCSVI